MAWEMHRLNPDPNAVRDCAVRYRGYACHRPLRWMLKGSGQDYAWAFYCDKHAPKIAERFGMTLPDPAWSGPAIVRA